MPGASERVIRSLVRERGRKNLSGFNVHADTVDDGPVNRAPDGGVQFADASQC